MNLNSFFGIYYDSYINFFKYDWDFFTLRPFFDSDKILFHIASYGLAFILLKLFCQGNVWDFISFSKLCWFQIESFFWHGVEFFELSLGLIRQISSKFIRLLGNWNELDFTLDFNQLMIPENYLGLVQTKKSLDLSHFFKDLT